MESLTMFVEFLKSCITPVALISGVGLILLTITNRYGRTIDRTRTLVAELDREETKRREVKIHEVKILYLRSKFLRSSIAAITFSIISSGLIIPQMVVMLFFSLDLRNLGYFLFSLSIISILISAIYFFLDIMLSLKAVKLEAIEYL